MPHSDETKTVVREQLINIFVGLLDRSNLTATLASAQDLSLLDQDLGIDSLDRRVIAMEVEDRFQINISNDELDKLNTFEEFLNLYPQEGSGNPPDGLTVGCPSLASTRPESPQPHRRSTIPATFIVTAVPAIEQDFTPQTPFKRLVDIIAGHMGCHKGAVTLASKLCANLGADPTDVEEMLIEVGLEFGFPPPSQTPADITVSQLMALITKEAPHLSIQH